MRRKSYFLFAKKKIEEKELKQSKQEQKKTLRYVPFSGFVLLYNYKTLRLIQEKEVWLGYIFKKIRFSPLKPKNICR